MFKTYLLVFIAFFSFLPIEAKLSDSIDLSSFLDLQFDEDLSRVRRDANSSTSTEDDIWTKRWNAWVNIIEKTSKRYYNISVIGWENVYDASGNIKQVNSLELSFPPREDAAEVKMLENAFRDDLHERNVQHDVVRHFEVYKRISAEGYLVDIFIESRDKHTGDSSTLLHWTPDSTYYRVGGLVTYNNTQTATAEEFDKFVSKLHSRNKSFLLSPSVLIYKETGSLTEYKGNISDPLSFVDTYVVESWQASDEILVKAPKIIKEAVMFVKKDKIPETLAHDFKQNFPKYDWRVLVNPGDFYLVKDVWIKLSTDGFDFYEGDKDTYFVYGIEA